ncbi:MAG: aminotransferase, partial [Pseudomonadota bacterium]
MRSTNPVFAGVGTTIFETMSRLAMAHEAINLGQGFPDEDGPLSMRERAAGALTSGPNQYPPMMGLPALREAVAAHAERHYGLSYDPGGEVLVTSGATEALADIALALLEPGDEAVVFEPLYDCYAPMIARSGAAVRTVRLHAPDWHIDEDALRAAFGPRTKLILLNTPHNPTGKVFTADELDLVAELVREHDAYAVCDEVYEHITFDGRPHIPLATLPGMAERTLRVGSAGKTFSMTGWKVGYVSGPAALVSLVAKAHQYVTFTTPPALQAAVAHGLDECADFYLGLSPDLEAKRDVLAAGLSRAGLKVLPCEGVYFLVADVGALGLAN